MEKVKFYEMLGLEEEFINEYSNELKKDYLEIKKIMREREFNFVSFADDFDIYSRDIKLNNKTYYNGEFSYVLGVL